MQSSLYQMSVRVLDTPQGSIPLKSEKLKKHLKYVKANKTAKNTAFCLNLFCQIKVPSRSVPEEKEFWEFWVLGSLKCHGMKS